MNRCFAALAIAILWALLAMPLAAQDAPRLTHVVLITIDGARPDAILEVGAPNIRGMADRGAYSWTARTVFPPATLPAHGSLLSGVSPSVHGQDDNVVRDCGDFDFPTVFNIAQEAGYQTAMVVGKAPLCQFRTSDDIGFYVGRAGDSSVVDQALELLDMGYNFLWLHLPNPDYFGHIAGWMSESYLRELQLTDLQIGRVLDHLDALDLTSSTLVVLTADHGGLGTVHGRDIPEDMTIPWLMVGPGVREAFDLAGPDLPDVTLLDTAPTLLWRMGLPVPEQMEGRVVCEAFIEALETDCPQAR